MRVLQNPASVPSPLHKRISALLLSLSAPLRLSTFFTWRYDLGNWMALINDSLTDTDIVHYIDLLTSILALPSHALTIERQIHTVPSRDSIQRFSFHMHRKVQNAFRS